MYRVTSYPSQQPESHVRNIVRNDLSAEIRSSGEPVLLRYVIEGPPNDISGRVHARQVSLTNLPRLIKVFKLQIKPDKPARNCNNRC